ncbi:hypothetical protein F5Y11DRAFT_352656 [Daldinia sp. FL1419]|nr:hypothetical protein F5Y11DRAFT_352656 [Daldinia sp. FL1419]
MRIRRASSDEALTGYSFRGAPVSTIGGNDERVIGCVTVASKTAETDGIRRLAPRPVLLLHGTGDTTLSHSGSKRLYAMYGNQGNRRIKLFDGDNHALSGNAHTAEDTLLDFIVNCAGLKIDKTEKRVVADHPRVEDCERIELMKKGGDLRPPEDLQ